MQVYMYPEIQVFLYKDARRSIQELDFIIQIGVEKLLSRDNPEFFSNNGYISNQFYYKRTVPAHLYSFFPFCIFLCLFCFPCTPSRLVSIRLCPCMTVKKLSIQRKWKCHIAGDSAIGLSGFCYTTFCGPIFPIQSVISSKRRKKLFILLVHFGCTFKIQVPFSVWRKKY